MEVHAALVIISIYTAASIAFGILLVPISEEMGWSRGQVSLAYALQQVSFAGFSLVAGWLSDRLGTRRVLLLGTLVFMASMFLAGQASHLWQLYLYFGLLLGASFSVYEAPLFTTMGLWFVKRLGLAVAIMATGYSLGPLFLVAPIRYAIERVGWGNALIITGVGSGLLLLAFSLLIRNRPEEVGLRPYGAEPTTPTTTTASVRPGVFYTGNEPNFLKHARHTPPFLSLPLIHLLLCANHAVIYAHVAAMATDAGLSPMAAAGVLALFPGFAIISRIGIGLLAEKDGKRALALALAIQASSVLMLLGAKETWSFYVFAFVFSLGLGGVSPPFPVLTRQYYGSAPVGTLLGMQMTGAGIGMGLGGYMGGFLFDLMGNYATAIVLSAVAGFLGLALTLKLPSPVAKPRAQPYPVL